MKENSIGDRIEEKYTRYLNCETDTLELTIEEAIFILETDASLHYVEDLLQEAYKVILSDYKKNIKENEHKTEKIENQKAELAILNEKQKDFNKLQNTLSSYKGQFRRQEKENEKLRKQLNEENKRCMMLAIEKQDYFEKYRYNLQQNESLTKEFSNVIPVQKIKDNIEELNQYYKKEIYPSLSQWRDITITEHYDDMIELLQELLGDK